MKNNYFFRTLMLIFKNAPLRFTACIGMLIFISTFPMLNLMAANVLISQFAASPFRADQTVVPGIAFIVTLLLINARAFINLLGSYIWITAEIALQGALVKKAAEKPLIFFDTPNFYTSLQRAKEGYKNAISTTMMLLSAVLVSLLSVIFMAGYLGQIDKRINIALVLIVFFKSISFLLETRRLQTLRANQAPDTKKCEQLASYFWTKETRIYGASGYFLEQWKALNTRITDERYAAEHKNLWAAFTLDSLTYLIYAAIVVISVYERLMHGNTAAVLNGVVLLFIAMDSIFTNLDTIVLQFGNLMKNASLSRDLFDFLSSGDDEIGMEELPINSKETPPDIAVCLKDVYFRYPQALRDTLKKIRLTVHTGENIAIVGRNGSGKSTLVKLLCRLYDPTMGTISFGRSLQLSMDNHENIAAMFQDVNTYFLSLAENVCISETQKPMDHKKAENILIEVMGTKWLSDYSDGVYTRVGRPFGGIDLSGGEKQRLSLARTLYRTSTLVFFDEPTSSLDPLAEDRLYQDILQLSNGKTTFFITHRLSSVRMADRIIVLDHGEIVEEGSFRTLMQQNGQFAKMYNLQKQGLE